MKKEPQSFQNDKEKEIYLTCMQAILTYKEPTTESTDFWYNVVLGGNSSSRSEYNEFGELIFDMTA